MSPEHHDIPVAVLAGTHSFKTDIEVEAEHCGAEPDVGLQEGYEIFSAKLVIDENLRGRVCNQITIWVDHGSPVDVAVDPELLAKADSINFDDEDLRDELSRYLNQE